MNAISLYCGAGGIDQGLKDAGIKTKLAIDFDKDCCITYKENFPDTEIIHGKVKDYVSSLPKANLLIGGPSCRIFVILQQDRFLCLPKDYVFPAF